MATENDINAIAFNALRIYFRDGLRPSVEHLAKRADALNLSDSERVALKNAFMKGIR
jgi:hypothetical protein